MTGCESKMAMTRSRNDQTGTGKVESLAVERDDGITKTKRSRMASVERRSQETDQSKHVVNGLRTEGGVGQKLLTDWRMTGFCK